MPIKQKQHSVFVSYAREDHDWVSVAANLLVAGGAKVFMDVRDIAYGDLWEDKLRSTLQQVERVLVFWSRHAAESEWVVQECELALEHGKRIVPVPIDTTPLPENLSQFQALNDLKHLLQPELDEHEPPKQYSKTSRGGLLAVAAALVLSFPIFWFFSTGSMDDGQNHVEPSIYPPGGLPQPPVNDSPPFYQAAFALDAGVWLVVGTIVGILVLLKRLAVARQKAKHEKALIQQRSGHHASPDLVEELKQSSSVDPQLGRRVVDMVFDD